MKKLLTLFVSLLMAVSAFGQSQGTAVRANNGFATNLTSVTLWQLGVGATPNFRMTPLLGGTVFASGGVGMGSVGDFGGSTGFAWQFSTNVFLSGGRYIGDGSGLTNLATAAGVGWVATNESRAVAITNTGNLLGGSLVAPNGAVGAPSIRFLNDTDTGLYSTGSGGTFSVTINGVNTWEFGDGVGGRMFRPAADNTYDIGTAVLRPANIWAANQIAAPLFTGGGAGLTNIGIVTSVTIPMGAWFTNNVADGASLSAASAMSVTNAGDAFCFTDGVTNVARTRFALPWDWNGSTVQVELRSTSAATNGLLATNSVFAVRAVAIGNNDRLDNLTFGTPIIMTNKIGTTAYTVQATIGSTLTIGNSPNSTKSILWEIQRLGTHAGDTTTNVVCITEARVYYKNNTRLDFPTATP